MVDVPRAHGLAVWLRLRSQHGAKKGERAFPGRDGRHGQPRGCRGQDSGERGGEGGGVRAHGSGFGERGSGRQWGE